MDFQKRSLRALNIFHCFEITMESEEQLPPGFENQIIFHISDLDSGATSKALEKEDAQLEEGEIRAQLIHEVEPPPGVQSPVSVKVVALSRQPPKRKRPKKILKRPIISRGPSMLTSTSQIL